MFILPCRYGKEVQLGKAGERRKGRRGAAAGRDATVLIPKKKPLALAGTRAAAVPDSIFTVRLGAVV